MGKITFILMLFIMPAALVGQLKNGYEIDVTVKGLQDSSLYLAYHFGDKQYIKDTIKVDKSGSGKFMGKESLPQGIYMIVLPGKKYFEILISEDQFFGTECSYSDYFGTLRFTGSDENTHLLFIRKTGWQCNERHLQLSNGYRITNRIMILFQFLIKNKKQWKRI